MCVSVNRGTLVAVCVCVCLCEVGVMWGRLFFRTSRVLFLMKHAESRFFILQVYSVYTGCYCSFVNDEIGQMPIDSC